VTRRAADTLIVPRPTRAAAYLAILRDYSGDLGGGLRWSATGDVIEFADEVTFAFAAEAIHFLEGFASQRPLIPFACVLRLLHLLRPRPETPPVSPAFALLRSAFIQAQRDYRNAGVFAAHLCGGVPSSPDAPTTEDLWRWLTLRQAGMTGVPDGAADVPPLNPPAFEARVERALAVYSHDEMIRWLRDGSGPLHDAGEELARQVQPPALGEVLDGVFQRERLGGAVPFVDQLVSVLALPPRRLTPPELPLGGYTDVTTRGHLEHLLPSQLAFDDLEFLRRVAQRELLYFRREEPHVGIREEMVVLLDQGVRTWGVVRLVLAAAVLALGRLAQRRRIGFLVGTSANGGELIDPVATLPAEVGQLLEASDLTPQPGLAVEKVLEAAAEFHRDVVLLTHPRNLAEADVQAAACRARPGVRLFALAVDEHGSAAFSELRRGKPVPLTKFSIDLNPPVQPAKAATPSATGWRGDVEAVPYPFVFGPGGGHICRLAFDCAAEWLLVATSDGMLYATHIATGRTEVLPRGVVDGKVATSVERLEGVRGGFVVVVAAQEDWFALHYDFTTRVCKSHRLAPLGIATLDEVFTAYLPASHLFILGSEREVVALELSTGSREVPAEVRILCSLRPPSRDPEGWLWRELLLRRQEPNDGTRSWPALGLCPDTGWIRLNGISPRWNLFTPTSEGRRILSDCVPVAGICCGDTLVMLVSSASTGELSEHIFRGPDGVPLGERSGLRSRCLPDLSRDGRLLARATGPAQAEVRDVIAGGPPTCVTRTGGFHSNVAVELGESWLAIQAERSLIHLVRWDQKPLRIKLGGGTLDRFLHCEMVAGDLGARGVPATDHPLPRGPGWLTDRERFRKIAVGARLVAAVDRFGEVALFRPDGALVAMFFLFRHELAIWLPDGTVQGPEALLGRPETPGTAERIASALATAEAS
jgi:hypothetical protein